MIIIIICVRRSRRQRWSQLHIRPDSKRTDLVSIGRLLALAAPPQMHMPSNNSSMLATTATTTMNMPSSLWLWLFLAHDKYQINILLMGGLFSGVIFFFVPFPRFIRSSAWRKRILVNYSLPSSHRSHFTFSIFFLAAVAIAVVVEQIGLDNSSWTVVIGSNKIFGQIMWDSLWKMTRDDWWSCHCFSVQLHVCFQMCLTVSWLLSGSVKATQLCWIACRVLNTPLHYWVLALVAWSSRGPSIDVWNGTSPLVPIYNRLIY